MLYLVSDVARHLTGQVFSFNGTELALWSPPHVAGVVSAESWSVGAIAAAVADGRLIPQHAVPPRRTPVPDA